MIFCECGGDVNEDDIVCLECGLEKEWGRDFHPHTCVKRGRPPTGFDKTAYMKEYMRKRRAAAKKPRD